MEDVKIKGLDGLNTVSDIQFEVNAGGKFVVYRYCISILILTFQRSSDIYFIREGESRFTKGLPFTLLSAMLGWWGFPWGLIYTPGAIFTNCMGGKDVTQEVMAHFGANHMQNQNELAKLVQEAV